jgi:hypothetical protein
VVTPAAVAGNKLNKPARRARAKAPHHLLGIISQQQQAPLFLPKPSLIFILITQKER